MNILITGGAGFIGSHLVDYLLMDNHTITVVDNLSLGRLENVAHNLDKNNFSFVECDILDFEKMDNIFLFNRFDAVFHLAANSDIAKSHDDPDIDFNNTFLTTYNILKLMKKYNVKQLIFSSTSAIYGETNSNINEEYGPLFPVSHYGAGKLASEAFIASFAENYGFKIWITRFPNVVGERATHGVIFDFINKLKLDPKELIVLGDGKQVKPYLYVKDLVNAIVFVWKNSNDKINYFNIGVATRSQVRDIAQMVVEEMKLDAKITYTGGTKGWIGDVPEFKYDLNKIHGLGWKASLTSDESVRKAIKYILEDTACNS